MNLATKMKTILWLVPLLAWSTLLRAQDVKIPANIESLSSKAKETAVETTPTLEGQLKQWEAYATGLKAKLTDRDEALVDKEKEVQILQNLTTGKKKTPKTPNPEVYKGDIDKIDAFIMQLFLKISENPDYDEEQEKKRLFFSLLRDRALVWAKPYIQGKEGYQDITFKALVQKLKNAFGDPDPHTKAETKLMRLYQGSWTFTKFLTETLALHADLDMDDSAKIMHFRRGLDPEISRLLLTNLNLPQTFEEFTTLCMQLDNNVQAFKRNQKGEPSYTKKVHLPPKQQQPY